MLQEPVPDSPPQDLIDNYHEATLIPPDDGKPHAYDLSLIRRLLDPDDIACIDTYQNETPHRELAARPLPEELAKKYRPIIHLLIHNANTYHDDPTLAEQVNSDRVARLLQGETKTIGDRPEYKQQLREALRARRTIGALAIKQGIEPNSQQ